MTKRPFISWCLWSLATWILLGIADYAVMQDLGKQPEHAVYWVLIGILPSLAIICGWRALQTAAMLPRWTRALFWMLALPAGAIFGVALASQWRVMLARSETRYLAISTFLPLVVGLWICVRERRSAADAGSLLTRLKATCKGWMLDIALGITGAAILVVVLSGVWIAKNELQARSLKQKALARWAEIGRPMPEFEKSLTPTKENASFAELLQDLNPLGVTSLYKRESNPSITDLARAAGETVEWFYKNGLQSTPADQLDTTPVAPPYLKAHAEELKGICQEILKREPPVWGCDPDNWFRFLSDPDRCKIPNYLVLRQLAQLFNGDALWRMQNGDSKGALATTTAGLRISKDLGKQPVLVSFMIRIAIEALFAPVTARMPENPDAWKQLENDAKVERDQLCKVLQAEAWRRVKCANQADVSTAKLLMSLITPESNRNSNLPGWAAPYMLSFMRLQAAKNLSAAAEQVRILQDIGNFRQGDLGMDEIERATGRDINVFTPNFARAIQRWNLSLLLREQAEAIRFARAQVHEGLTHAEHDSVVIPGAKWEVIGDPAANSAALKLVPTPPWAINNDCAGPDFFLLPFDGSKSWKFAPPM